jgi:hypothetical protein
MEARGNAGIRGGKVFDVEEHDMNRFCRMSPFVLVVAAWMSPVAHAQTDLSKFPLAKALPKDCFIAVAARGNPERKFLNEYWKQVHVALMESGILSDVWDLVMEHVEDDKLEMIEDIQSRFTKLCGEVDWEHLFSKEHVFAMRFFSPVPQAFAPEGVILGRMEKGQAQENYKHFKAILDEVVKLVESQGGKGALTINEVSKDGYTLASIGPAEAPALGISVAAYKDVIAIGFGTSALLEESIGLLKGTSENKGLIQTERFKKAFSSLPPAEDKLVFFDTTNMTTKLGDFFKKIEAGTRKHSGKKHVAAKKKPAAESEDKDEDGDKENAADEPDGDFNPLPMMNRIIGDITFVDFVAEVEWTDGRRVFTTSYASLLPHAEENTLTQVFTKVNAPTDFAKFIPKNATTFSCTAGFNFSGLYDYLRGIFKDEIPNGEGMLEQFDTMQNTQWGINLDKDVFQVYNGPITSVQMGSDWALLIGVSDSEKSRDQLKRLFAFVNEQLSQNQRVTLSQVDVGAKNKFTQVTHPMMMMVGGFAPVFGVAEGNLIIGSSSKSVVTILKTAQGKLPNITKSKQFQEEALAPKGGTLDSISFTDERKFGDELQQGLGAMSMGLGIVTMMVQSQDIPPPVQNLCKAIPPILAKLGPVAGKLNFYQSSARYTTFDGKGWLTREVQNYKDPSEIPVAAEPSENEKSKDAEAPSHRKHKAPKDADAADDDNKKDSDSDD